MDRFRNLIPLALVVALGIVVQVVLVAADSNETPARTAVAFTEAFYKMSPHVADHLCSDLREEQHPEGIFEQAAAEANLKGFSDAYPRMQLFQVETEVLTQNDASAQVQLKATMKRAIHPAFAYFLRMWNMGETYHLDEVVELVREDGRWRVCGYDYALII